MNRILFPISLLFIFTSSIFAQSTTHDAHEHGTGELQISIEQNSLIFELHIPGSDFIGFEYSNLSEEEELALLKKIESVEAADNLITFNAGWFNSVTQKEIEVHKDDHDDEQEPQGEHNEYQVHIEYSIKNLSKVKSANVQGIFELFPDLEEIQWIFISDKGQSAGKANADSTKIDLGN